MVTPRAAVGLVVLAVLVASGCSGEPDDEADASSSAALHGTAQRADAPVTPFPEVTDGPWTRLPMAPIEPRHSAGLVEVGAQVLVLGGSTLLCPPTAGCVRSPEAPPLDGALYDPASRTWTEIEPAPMQVEATSATVIGDVVYALGCDGEPWCDDPTLLAYDAGADAWSEHGTVPEGFARLQRLGDRLLVSAGGYGEEAAVDAVYDPATGRWATLPDDPLPWVFDRGVVPVDADGEQLLAVGTRMSALRPRNGERTPADQAHPAAVLDVASGAWRRVDDAPASGFVMTASAAGPLLMNGGERGVGWRLDVAGGSWERLPGRRAPSTWISAVIDLDGRVLPVRDLAPLGPKESTIYDLRDGSIGVVPPITRWGGVTESAMASVGRGVLVHGGQRWERDDETPGATSSGELVGDSWLWTPPTGPDPTDSGGPGEAGPDRSGSIRER